VALSIIGIAAVLYSGNIFFYAMRVSAWRVGNARVGLSALSERAVDLMQNGRGRQFDFEITRNLQDRTFVLRYISDLLAASWTHEPLWGRDAIFCLESAIPSVIHPDKDRVRAIGMEENLANPNFGLFAEDESNSILTTGVSDFGIAGAFVYPILLVSLMSAFARRLIRNLPERVSVLVVLAVLNIMWQTEMSSSAYFILCRNLIILSIPLAAMSRVGGCYAKSSGVLGPHGCSLGDCGLQDQCLLYTRGRRPERRG